MRVLYVTNIPSPYRVDFFNELGKNAELEVVFEAKNTNTTTFDYNYSFNSFKATFLNKRSIKEKKVNFSIIKIIKRFKNDTIIFSGYSSPTVILAILYCKMKKIQYIVEDDGGFNKKDGFLKKQIKSFLVRKAKAIFTTCVESINHYKFLGVKSEKIFKYPFTSVRNGDILTQVVSYDKKEKLRQKLEIKENRIVLSIGQFIHRKGYDVLLKSLKGIDKSVGIYIVGGIPTQEYINLQKELDLTNVHFVGFKSKMELKEYYMTADLFVLPTREDIWGLVINEAMAFGLPIVTTKRCIAGLELVKENINGNLVEVENERELREKIDEIICDRKKQSEYGKSSLEQIKKYTIEEMSNWHVKTINNINGVLING